MIKKSINITTGLDQFDKFVSLAHFLVSKKRRTAYLRTPFHYFQLTSRALTVPLLLPSRLHGDGSPYYSFVATTKALRGHGQAWPGWI